jgi:plasmid stability protein
VPARTVSEAGVTISTYLPPADAAILRDRAAAADRSIAAEIRRALRGYLKDDERRVHQPGAVEDRPDGGERESG